MEADLGDAVTVIRRRTDVVFGSVLSVVLVAFMVWALTDPYPGSDFADQVELTVIAMLSGWPGVLATVHPRVEVRARGLLVVNWFTKSRIPWSAIESVLVEGRLVLLLRGGRRIDIAAGAGSLASAVTGYRMQARMKRLIEDARQPDPRDDGQVRTQPDLWPVPFLVASTVLLLIGWLAVA
ncbi:PH domain-containing protein [Saccharothrix variisporea]|uniref:PH (Pleckstrin Homology) domain-containing protein n=1 Tax=Saccharothrix variisporea TaxID=543527 RepID=A0A495X5P9_9PSEU|nr:PH domain-containing protein [Saccharothrix variisporea]RKT69292.1 PH (Pleckstrin Homology) domain-containing protein [Saccharothrix variisporea]